MDGKIVQQPKEDFAYVDFGYGYRLKIVNKKE